MARKSEFEYASYDDFMLPDVDSAECQANLMIYSWDKKNIHKDLHTWEGYLK